MVHTAEVLLGAEGEETLEEAPPFGLRPTFKLQRANRCIVLNAKKFISYDFSSASYEKVLTSPQD